VCRFRKAERKIQIDVRHSKKQRWKCQSKLNVSLEVGYVARSWICCLKLDMLLRIESNALI
jgi:hypothetical protein